MYTEQEAPPPPHSSPTDFDRITALIKEYTHIANSGSDDNDAILAVGNTGSGKSTVVAYALGCNLTAQDDGWGKLLLSQPSDSSENMPVIGQEIESETKFPQKFVDTKNNISYWDCPGEKDTHGSDYDILHAMQMKALLKPDKGTNVKKIRVMLVIVDHDLFEKGGDFTRLMDYVAPWFEDDRTARKALYLIVTKSRRKESHVRDRLRKLLDSFKNLSPAQKKVLTALSDEESALTVFPEPIVEGPFSQDMREEIIRKIKGLEGCVPCNQMIVLSASSKNLLGKLVSHYEDRTRQSFAEMIQAVELKCRKDVKEKTEYDDAAHMVKTISAFVDELAQKRSTRDIHDHWLFAEPTFSSNNIHALTAELQDNIHYLHFVSTISPDFIVSREASWIQPPSEALNTIKSLIQQSQPYYHPLFKILRVTGTILSLKLIAEQLSRQTDFLSVEIFCSNTIFLDTDLKLPGINLTIIAPVWKVTHPITIDLRGKDGESATGYDEMNGRPGGPGGRGGNFVGRALKVRNANNLTINIAGGNGGDGADGKDGEDGEAGDDGDVGSIWKRDESVLVRRHVAMFREGKIKRVAEIAFTVNHRIIYEFESKGKRGKNGKHGGKGGFGGYGGFPGEIDLKILNQQDDDLFGAYHVKQSTGEDGKAGKPGRGGKGGKGGKTYFGVFQEGKVFANIRGLSEEIRTEPSEPSQDSSIGSGGVNSQSRHPSQENRDPQGNNYPQAAVAGWGDLLRISNRLPGLPLISAGLKKLLPLASKPLLGVAAGGIGIAATGSLSVVHAYLSDHWIKEPQCKVEEEDRDGKDGEVPTDNYCSGIILPETNSQPDVGRILEEFQQIFIESQEFKANIYNHFL